MAALVGVCVAAADAADRAQRSCLIAYGNLEGLRPDGCVVRRFARNRREIFNDLASSALTPTARRLQPDAPVGPPELSPRCEGSANPPDEEEAKLRQAFVDD